MAEFIKNRPFRFWCQKVLPLVYDDSLSYYELLCKVVCKLNEMAENQNNLSDEIKQVAQDLDDFKNQVPGMIEAKVQEWLDNYITTHGLVNSVNGMKGNVVLKKLTATTEGGLSISGEDGYNGSEDKTIGIAAGGVTTEKIGNGAVTADKLAEGAVTADKLADGAIPEKLPNPHKLTFSGAVTGEYDGSEEVNINIPNGGGGGGTGGAVNSVNGMTGDVVLKKLTASAGGGLSISGEQGYNGSEEKTIEIAAGGVTADKLAEDVVPEKLPNPHKLTFSGAVTGEYDGSAEVNINIPNAGGDVQNVSGNKTVATNYNLYLQINSIGKIMVATAKVTPLNPKSSPDVTAAVDDRYHLDTTHGVTSNNRFGYMAMVDVTTNTHIADCIVSEEKDGKTYVRFTKPAGKTLTRFMTLVGSCALTY